MKLAIILKNDWKMNQIWLLYILIFMLVQLNDVCCFRLVSSPSTFTTPTRQNSITTSSSSNKNIINRLKFSPRTPEDNNHFSRNDWKLLSSRMRMYGPTLSRSNLFEVTATNIIVLINAVVFLLVSNYPSLKWNWMKINYLIGRGEFYRLLTAIFLHSDFYHLLNNCYTVLNIGPAVSSVLLISWD